MTVLLSFAFFAAILTHIGCSNQRRSPENGGRRYNRIQHGQCAYTFILPEHDGNCRESATEQYNTNALQRDAPHVEPDFSSQKLQHLEHVMENYTQWLQKVSACLHSRDSIPTCELLSPKTCAKLWPQCGQKDHEEASIVPIEPPPTSRGVGRWRDDLSRQAGGRKETASDCPFLGLRVGEGPGQAFLAGPLCSALGHEIEEAAEIAGARP
ncbi:hypothetical protein LEMLEM_LOCUS11195 [Lemmus lemmus]